MPVTSYKMLCLYTSLQNTKLQTAPCTLSLFLVSAALFQVCDIETKLIMKFTRRNMSQCNIKLIF
jgi:hypothetical protein